MPKGYMFAASGFAPRVMAPALALAPIVAATMSREAIRLIGNMKRQNTEEVRNGHDYVGSRGTVTHLRIDVTFMPFMPSEDAGILQSERYSVICPIDET